MAPRPLVAVPLAALAGTVAFGLVHREVAHRVEPEASLLLALALVPPLLVILALATERARDELRRRAAIGPLVAALAVVPSLALASAAAGRFDVRAFAAVAVLATAVPALVATRPPGSRPGLADVVAWLALFLPVDLRLLKPALPQLHYELAALAATAIALVSWSGARDLPELGHRVPRPRDLAWSLAALLAFGALAIPAGLAVTFLKAPHLPVSPPLAVLVLSAGVAFTIALPEEVFFRGVLDGGLRRATGRPMVSLVVSSLLFGLSHWNNEKTLAARAIYCGLAAVAGVFYGLAYRRSGGLPAAVLAHTAVDVVWKECLR